MITKYILILFCLMSTSCISKRISRDTAVKYQTKINITARSIAESVYLAETVAFSWKFEFNNKEEVKIYVKHVTTNLISKYIEKFPPVIVEITDHDSSYGRIVKLPGGMKIATIELTKSMLYEQVVIHELAHVMAPYDIFGHGVFFRNEYLNLIYHLVDTETYNMLRVSFIMFKLDTKFHNIRDRKDAGKIGIEARNKVLQYRKLHP